MDLQKRKEKLLYDAARYRNFTFTLTKMTNYYGQKYSDALDRAQKGEAYAFCLLGRMFEESVYHAKEHRDYDYPPFGCQEAARTYYELAVINGCDRTYFSEITGQHLILKKPFCMVKLQ